MGDRACHTLIWRWYSPAPDLPIGEHHAAAIAGEPPEVAHRTARVSLDHLAKAGGPAHMAFAHACSLLALFDGKLSGATLAAALGAIPRFPWKPRWQPWPGNLTSGMRQSCGVLARPCPPACRAPLRRVAFQTQALAVDQIRASLGFQSWVKGRPKLLPSQDTKEADYIGV